MAIDRFTIEWQGTLTRQELVELQRVWPGRFVATQQQAEPAMAQVTTKPARGARTKPAKPEE